MAEIIQLQMEGKELDPVLQNKKKLFLCVFSCSTGVKGRSRTQQV